MLNTKEIHVSLSIPFELITGLLWMLAALGVFPAMGASTRSETVYGVAGGWIQYLQLVTTVIILAG